MSNQFLITGEQLRASAVLSPLITHDHYIAKIAANGTVTLAPAVFVEATRARGHEAPQEEPAAESPETVHPFRAEPARDAPWFGADGREVQPHALQDISQYPVTSACRCGRQVASAGYGQPWQHCD